mgnify:CR=1 FL=1
MKQTCIRNGWSCWLLDDDDAVCPVIIDGWINVQIHMWIKMFGNGHQYLIQSMFVWIDDDDFDLNDADADNWKALYDALMNDDDDDDDLKMYSVVYCYNLKMIMIEEKNEIRNYSTNYAINYFPINTRQRREKQLR